MPLAEICGLPRIVSLESLSQIIKNKCEWREIGLTEQHLYPKEYVCPSTPGDQVGVEDASPESSGGHGLVC